MAAGESAVTSATMRPDNLVLIPKAFVGCRPNREYFSLEIGTGGRYALHPGVKCRDDEFVFRVRVRPGLGEPGDERERVAGLARHLLSDSRSCPRRPPTSISESRLHMTARQSVCSTATPGAGSSNLPRRSAFHRKVMIFDPTRVESPYRVKRPCTPIISMCRRANPRPATIRVFSSGPAKAARTTTAARTTSLPLTF